MKTVLIGFLAGYAIMYAVWPAPIYDRRDQAINAVTVQCGTAGVRVYEVEGQNRIAYGCGPTFTLKTREY